MKKLPLLLAALMLCAAWQTHADPPRASTADAGTPGTRTTVLSDGRRVVVDPEGLVQIFDRSGRLSSEGGCTASLSNNYDAAVAFFRAVQEKFAAKDAEGLADLSAPDCLFRGDRSRRRRRTRAALVRQWQRVLRNTELCSRITSEPAEAIFCNEDGAMFLNFLWADNGGDLGAPYRLITGG